MSQRATGLQRGACKGLVMVCMLATMTVCTNGALTGLRDNPKEMKATNVQSSQAYVEPGVAMHRHEVQHSAKKGLFDGGGGGLLGAVTNVAKSLPGVKEVLCQVCKIVGDHMVQIHSTATVDLDYVREVSKACDLAASVPGGKDVCTKEIASKADGMVDEVVDYGEEDSQQICIRINSCEGTARPRKNKCPGPKHKPCSGVTRGKCDHNSGKCTCLPAWTGLDCSQQKQEAPQQPPPQPQPQQPQVPPQPVPPPQPVVKQCPGNCNNHGSCNTNTGVCNCNGEWTGNDCSSSKCPNGCNGHGACRCAGEACSCRCSDGFSGVDCSQRQCPANCNGHGQCDHDTGKCTCSNEFEGDSCQLHRCPPYNGGPSCSGHGNCDNRPNMGKCTCNPGWEGAGCEVPPPVQCPTNEPDVACSGHGFCDTNSGKCTCHGSWSGEDCNANTSSCVTILDQATAAHSTHSPRHGEGEEIPDDPNTAQDQGVQNTPGRVNVPPM